MGRMAHQAHDEHIDRVVEVRRAVEEQVHGPVLQRLDPVTVNTEVARFRDPDVLQAFCVFGGILHVDRGDAPGIDRQRGAFPVEDHTEVASLIRGLIGDRREGIMAFSLDRLIVEMRGRIVFVEVFVEAIFVGKRCRLPEALDDALVFIRDTVRKIAERRGSSHG